MKFCILLLFLPISSVAFFAVPPATTSQPFNTKRRLTRTSLSSQSADDWANAAMSKSVELEGLKAMVIGDMKAGQLKKELTLRGLSTEGLFEKADLLDALRDARENKVEKFQHQEEEGPARQQAVTEETVSIPTNDASDDVASMRVGELKKELDSYGVGYSDLFEKPEFVERVKTCRKEGRGKVGGGGGGPWGASLRGGKYRSGRCSGLKSNARYAVGVRSGGCKERRV